MTLCKGVPQGLMYGRVDSTVTNYGADKRIRFPDSRFTVICLDRLNQTRTQHKYIRCPSWDSNLAPIQDWSVTASSVFTDLHNLKSDIVRMGGQRPLHSPCWERPGNWRSVIGPSSWTPVAPITTGHAFASLCKSTTWGTLCKSSVYAPACVRAYMCVCN